MKNERSLGLREAQIESKSKVLGKKHATSVKYRRRKLSRNQMEATNGHVRH